MKQLAKPSRTLPSTSKGLSEASPAGRPAAASLWPVRGLPPLSAAGRPVAASLWPVRSLPPLFLYGLPKATLGILDRLQTLLGSWQACCGLSVARHFGTASNPRVKQLAKPSRTLPSTSKGLSEASPAGRPAAASLWPVRGLPPLSAGGRPVAASLWPVRSLPPLFLWASEGDVRHFGPPSNPPRQPAGLFRPLCGLSEACLLSSYGLPKATLAILDHLQTLLGSRQACCDLSVACPKPAYGLPKATLGILDRLQTLLGSRQACCGLSVACPKPASSLLLGFRRRR